MISVIYLIDIKNAPPIVRAVTDYLNPLTELDAAEQLWGLLSFLGVEGFDS
jgi:hypothetical protein